jgi:MFS family permease
MRQRSGQHRRWLVVAIIAALIGGIASQLSTSSALLPAWIKSVSPPWLPFGLQWALGLVSAALSIPIAMVVWRAQTLINPPSGPMSDPERDRLIGRLRRRHTRVLDAALPLGTRLPLTCKIMRGMVASPIDDLVSADLVNPNAAQADTFPSGMPISQIFTQAAGESLLILGKPGAGRRILLYELAAQLLDRAYADRSQPLPMIFYLASWTPKYPTLVDWLVREVQSDFGKGRDEAQAWIAQHHILPLLYGLEEVPESCRARCVAAINAFVKNYPDAAMVVSSRTGNYDDLRWTARLQLSLAVEVQPIQPPQMRAYLEELVTVGREANAALAQERTSASAGAEPSEQPRTYHKRAKVGEAAARALGALDANAILRNLITTPFMLSVLVEAAHGWPADGIPTAHDIAPLRRQLFAAYVSRRLREGPASRSAAAPRDIPAATQERTQERATDPVREARERRWLGWLAAKPCAGGGVFYLDQLQEGWLAGGRPLGRYPLPPRWGRFAARSADRWALLPAWLGVALVIGLTSAFAGAFTQRPLFGHLLFGLVYGTVIGMAAGWSIGMEVPPARVTRWSWQGFVVGLLIGAIVPLVGLALLPIIVAALTLFASDQSPSREGGTQTWARVTAGWKRWLFFGLVGLLAVLLGLLLLGLEWRGLLFWLFPDLPLNQPAPLNQWPAMLLATMLSAGVFRLLIGLILAVVVGLLPGRLDAGPLRPNQRIWQSAVNSLLAGLVAVILVGAVGLLSTAAQHAAGQPAPNVEGAPDYIPVLVGAALGLAVALFGGLAALRHAALRCRLWLAGDAPLHYTRFLESAVRRALLVRAGSGYTFIYDMLVDYLAADYLTHYGPAGATGQPAQAASPLGSSSEPAG